MSVLEMADPPAAARRRRHPHPGEGVPSFSWPTFGLAVAGITVFAVVAAGAARGTLPAWVVISLSTLVTYVMFSVAHEALHRSFCSVRWVNAVVGRLAWLLVSGDKCSHHNTLMTRLSAWNIYVGHLCLFVSD